MAKIQTPNLHQTPGGKNGFFRQLQFTIQCARERVVELDGSRKLDMDASGAIHAVALLASEVSTRLPVSRMEVEHWRDTFFAWFKRVKRNFPEGVSDEYLANATADFEVIWDRADTFSPVPWEQVMARFQWRVDFVNREYFDAACEAAKQKYPVKLGIALDKYLKACVTRVVSDDDQESPLVVTVSEQAPVDKPGTVAPRIICCDDGVHSLIVTSFEGFGSKPNTAYALQNAVKKYLKENSKETLAKLDFDSESSMFCVRSNDLTSLAKVSEAIYTIVADSKIREASLETKKAKAKSKTAARKKKSSLKKKPRK